MIFIISKFSETKVDYLLHLYLLLSLAACPGGSPVLSVCIVVGCPWRRIFYWFGYVHMLMNIFFCVCSLQYMVAVF